MAKIIFRLEKDNIDKYLIFFNCDNYNTSYEEWLELIKSRYIDDRSTKYDNNYLHIYRTFMYNHDYTSKSIDINMPFNFTNKNYFYIDYLYYRRVINELNRIIFINKRYLIDITNMGLRSYVNLQEMRKIDDPIYNKDTYKAFHAVIEIKYNDNK